MDWKEKIKEFQGFGFPTGLSEDEMKTFEDFIESQIIKPLIADIPDQKKVKVWDRRVTEGKEIIIDTTDLKQELRERWL